MRASRVLIAVLAASCAAPAAAEPWVRAGRWNIYKGEAWCQALTFDGPTMVGLDVTRLGGSNVRLSEKAWSFEAGQVYDVTLRLDEAVVAPTTAEGALPLGDLRTIRVSIPLLTLDRLGEAKALRVFRDGAPFRDLSLEGAAAAVTQLKACLAQVMRERPDVPAPRPGRRAPAA